MMVARLRPVQGERDHAIGVGAQQYRRFRGVSDLVGSCHSLFLAVSFRRASMETLYYAQQLCDSRESATVALNPIPGAIGRIDDTRPRVSVFNRR